MTYHFSGTTKDELQSWKAAAEELTIEVTATTVYNANTCTWLVHMCMCVCRALHVSGTEDLLLYLASSDNERQFSFHVLEIISLMFREQVSASVCKCI